MFVLLSYVGKACLGVLTLNVQIAQDLNSLNKSPEISQLNILRCSQLRGALVGQLLI